MEQQINTSALGEPSQIRRDSEIFQAIYRTGFDFRLRQFLYILQRLNKGTATPRMIVSPL
jgi:RNase P protein component